MKKAKVRREWLNGKDSDETSFVCVSVYPPETGEKSFSYFYHDMDLKIADCTRSINLEFGFQSYDKKGIKARQQKVGKLLAALDGVYDVLEEAERNVTEEKKRYDAWMKERKSTGWV